VEIDFLDHYIRPRGAVLGRDPRLSSLLISFEKNPIEPITLGNSDLGFDFLLFGFIFYQRISFTPRKLSVIFLLARHCRPCA
jgi:hypothetical protein